MKKHYLLFAWSLVIIWMGIIFYLSHQPANASSELSSGITQIVIVIIETVVPSVSVEIETWHFFIRKSAHFIAYFLLGLFIIHALLVSRLHIIKGIVIATIMSFLYAISDEVHQLFIPGRSGEVRDVIIDTMGALSGILLFAFIVIVYDRRKRLRNKDNNITG